MRLKTLNLQGFKTFAPKTDLVFGEGLSAVVGPNGSGKSNIADSIRWVLGEQSLSHLRAKKTEDLIFAGSSNRAPLGMAEVSITLDNSDRLLPLDFTEVTLTRRAYRSGENEYYINKSRVRLRDITELASTLGQAYTVVGQGLIDAALSLRPEERRELFEEAATIRGYFVQREEALRRLGKTEENIARVNDLAVELEPQVRRLERQARQAQDYGKLEAELHTLLREWFRGRWTLGSHELKRATEAEEAAAAQVEVRKQEVTRISIELAEARAQVRSHLGRTSELHEQRARVQALHAAKSQSLAVLEERLSAGTARSGTLAQEQKQTQQALASLRDQLSGVEEESQQRSNELGALREAGKSVTSKLSELDATLRDLRKRRDSADAEVQAYTNKLRDLTTRLEAASRQLTEQTQFVDQEKQQIVLLEKSLSSRQTAVKQQESDLEAAQSAVKAAEQAHREARAELEAARSGQSAAEAKRRELARQADQLSGQLALVTGEQQAGLYGGVRAVVAAAGRKELDGYLGTVADLISVPAELETAIEAGLGGRLQEVVMATWGHTEKAISMLKQKGAGRATFLPLDTLRAHRNGQAPSGAGILGLARDLVRYEPPLATLAESLMGRLLIVEDLPAARRTIASLQASTPWTLATIEGEVVRPGGSVTGGSNSSAGDARAKGRTILALQRRRRELEQTRDDLAEQVEASEKELARAISLVQRQEAGLGSRAAAVDTARQQALKAQVAHMEQENAQAGLRREIGWHRDRVGEAAGKIGSLHDLEQQLAAQCRDAEVLLEQSRAQLAAAEQNAAEALEAREQAVRAAGEEQTRLAVLTEALRNTEVQVTDLRVRVSQLEKRSSDLAHEAAIVSSSEGALRAEAESQKVELAALATQLQTIEEEVAPSEERAKSLEAEVARIESGQSALQSALLELETAHSRAAVAKQRSIDVLESLKREMAEELGGASEDGPFEHFEVPQDFLDAEHSGQEQANPASNAERERRVYALKGRLSRIGPVNPMAVEEHTELLERQTYLQAQLHDLTGAAESLRHVISELDRAMREQFAATFVQVNDAFQYFFKSLFGGGTAQLELTNPHDVAASGVEISAQPPGKRMQPLAALSGGERALTSAALLFALLKVRPVPFCVLDEVDAALDESNVTRFRSALQELGRQTQFVLITHNRGTIEAADTLYGVSMAGDGTSQLLSLKVGA